MLIPPALESYKICQIVHLQTKKQLKGRKEHMSTKEKVFGPVSKLFSACCHPQNNSGLMAETTTEFHIFTKKM